MRSWIRNTAAALLACAVTAPAHAGPAIDWDPAYFYAAGATPYSSPPGTQLFIVGTISSFGPPLNFLNPNDPAKEYTFYLSGLTSLGTSTTPIPGFGNAYLATYDPGVIQVYEGSPRDADFGINPPNGTAPSTFTNGTLLLSGTVNSFYTQTNDFSTFMTGNAEGNITWTGGTLLSFVSKNGQPCPSLFTGGLTWLPSVMIPGYLFRHDGKIDLDCPTPSQSSTWGRLKSLYR